MWLVKRLIRTSSIVVAVVALGLIAHPCFGWGAEGHRIIGAIAWHFLTDEAKKAIDDLLGGQTLAEAGCWADEIRSNPTYDWAKPLHYINVSRDTEVVRMQRDCSDGKCVLGAIDLYAKVLRSPNASRETKIEALKFLVHFVEDVHQPLHVSYADDRGGNSVDVEWFGKKTNLHSVWDNNLIEQRLGRSEWIAYADHIRESIPENEIKGWQSVKINPEMWATESLTLTRRIYRELPNDGELDDQYFQRNIGVVEERLAAAGVRLAMILNEIFGEQALETSASQPADGGSDAGLFVKIIEGGACGNADGRSIYLVNGHDSRLIRVKVRKAWSANGKAQTSDQEIVVRPGRANRRQLGCSQQRIGRGEIRSFDWEIIAAQFADR